MSSGGPSYAGLSAYPPSPPQLSPNNMQTSSSSQGTSQLPTPLQPMPGPSSQAPYAPPSATAAIVHFDPDASDDDDDDDEGRPKKKSKAGGGEGGDGEDGEKEKGRRKIDIKYIEKKEKRHITFSKRKAGIMKKAYELATLTGTQVLLLVVSETGIVYTFTTTKFQPLVGAGEGGLPSDGQRLIQQCLAVDPDENSDYISPPPDGPLLPLPPSAAKRPFETNSAIHGGQISLRTRTHRPSARAKRPANIRTSNPSPTSATGGPSTSSPGFKPNPSPPASGTLPSPLTAIPMGVTMPRSPMHPPTPGIHVAMEMAGGPGPSQPGGGGQGIGMPVSPGPGMHRLQQHHHRLESGDMRMHTSPTNREYPTSPGLSGGGPGLRGHDPMQSQQEYAAMMHRAAMSAQGTSQYGHQRDTYGVDPYGQPTRYAASPANSPRQPHMDAAQLQQRIAQAQQMEQQQQQQQHHQAFHAPVATDESGHLMVQSGYLPPQQQYGHPGDQYMMDQHR